MSIIQEILKANAGKDLTWAERRIKELIPWRIQGLILLFHGTPIADLIIKWLGITIRVSEKKIGETKATKEVKIFKGGKLEFEKTFDITPVADGIINKHGKERKNREKQNNKAD